MCENAKTIINNIKDLEAVTKEYNNSLEKYEYIIQLCYGAGCISSGSKAIKEILEKELEEAGIESKVKINLTGCMGMCDVGPIMVIIPDGVLYCNLNENCIKDIVIKHLVNKKIVYSCCYVDKKTDKTIPYMKDIGFYSKQKKNVLKNCGKIDFNSLEEYISSKGYYSLLKVISGMIPDEVIEEVSKSGLRGRGGGGFPTGLKWKLARKSVGDIKYVICNADEGDPGAFMDRSLLEGDPHLVLEGMIIAGYAIGSNKGYIYVRAEYPIAIERLKKAIEQAKERKLLGNNIFGTEFSFDIEIRIGAGAFVCGEETALIASVEGKRGEPKQKPPYPSDEGLFGKPTIINNVETFGNIASIILNGADWYNQFGTEGSKGTKIFAIAGDINNTGIIEVPMGITLGEIIYDVGGGIPNKRKFKAAQSGGPSGGCLTKEQLNTPIDYDSLKDLGVIMGSGGLICMSEDTCMVDIARYFMEFVQEESCGKCVPCRLGSKRMLEILERITRGEGVEGDIEKLIELGNVMKDTALCGLGQSAPNPVLSTIKFFREEYEEHIHKKYCRASVCGNLFISPCENACPANVNVPGYIALIAAGRFRDAYELIRQENPFPLVCGSVCTHPCEGVCRRGQIDEALAIADLKKYVAQTVLKADLPFTNLVFPRNGKSIGIIGAGPSGLTCGYYLARLGYEVKVYESQPVAGGILAFGIPEYRLPKEMLEKEISSIKCVGVDILLNTEVGKDIEFEKIREIHDAVYVATGTQFSRKVGIKGENLEGVYHGLDFLRDVNINKNVEVGKHVGVVGGGSTAIDAARTALRLGAETVDILYRRRIKEMPAEHREVLDAIEEGIIIHELVLPEEFVGAKGKVTQVKCSRMILKGFDKNGRRNPFVIANSEFIIDVDMVIPAISQYSDLPFIKKEEVEVTKWGSFIVDDDTFMTKKEGVFAGGDVVRGSDVVITAIADGKKAAQEIDKYLGGKGILNKGEKIEIPQNFDDSDIIEHDRFPLECLDPEIRKHNFDEVKKGYHKINAIAEAMRCLRCDRRQ